MLASTITPRVWPASNTCGVWLAREFIHAAVLLPMGLEIALRLVLRLPDARREARRWIVPVLVICGVIVAPARSAPPMSSLLPLLMLAIAWLYPT